MCHAKRTPEAASNSFFFSSLNEPRTALDGRGKRPWPGSTRSGGFQPPEAIRSPTNSGAILTLLRLRSMAEYTEITDLERQSRVRSRYTREMASLQALGFRHLAFCIEALGPFSAILQLPALLLMLRKKEVLVFPSPLRLAVANVLLVHGQPSSVALCMGMGVKIYTRFSDHSLLISSTFRSHAVPGPASPIIRNPPSQTPEEAWICHKKSVLEIESLGKSVAHSGSLGDYIELSQREEDLSQYVL